jgi:hypothetical protein
LQAGTFAGGTIALSSPRANTLDSIKDKIDDFKTAKAEGFIGFSKTKLLTSLLKTTTGLSSQMLSFCEQFSHITMVSGKS